MPEKGWKTISVPDDFYDYLEREAKRQNRTVSNLVQTLLKQILEAQRN